MYDVSLPVSTDYQRNSLYRERGSRCNDEETRWLAGRGGKVGGLRVFRACRAEPTIQIELTSSITRGIIYVVTNARTHDARRDAAKFNHNIQTTQAPTNSRPERPLAVRNFSLID